MLPAVRNGMTGLAAAPGPKRAVSAAPGHEETAEMPVSLHGVFRQTLGGSCPATRNAQADPNRLQIMGPKSSLLLDLAALSIARGLRDSWSRPALREPPTTGRLEGPSEDS